MRAVLFDVVGTLVTHQPDHLQFDYPETALLVHGWGHENAGERFADVWSAVVRTLELTSSGQLVEFSMHDVVAAYDHTEQLGLDDHRRAELLASFTREWSLGVRLIDGVNELLADLGAKVPFGIVANTQDSDLVRNTLDRFGLASAHFDPVVTSVEHGHRKPHPSIYVTAFEALAARVRHTSPDDPPLQPDDVLFVGDEYAGDYAGPVAAGFHARLVDPWRRHPIPSEHRLQSVLDLPHHLHTTVAPQIAPVRSESGV